MRAAVRVEALKLAHSPVGVTASLAMVLGTLALLGSITFGVASGNAELIAKAGPAAAADWGGLLAGATQIIAVVGILGCGVVLAWMFGREFGEGTVAGLFALPTRRATIALAKLIVFAVWALVVSVALAFGVLLLGLALSYGAPGVHEWGVLARLVVLGLLSAGLAVPAAWIATTTRSLLAAVGGTIAIVVIAQVGALAGAGGWMPFAAPALWALSSGTAVTEAQLAISLLVPAVFAVLVCAAWSRLQLHR